MSPPPPHCDNRMHERFLNHQARLDTPSDPDCSCGWVNIKKVLGTELIGKVHEWARTTNFEKRPWAEVRNSDAIPGGIWLMGDPVAVHIGEKLTAAVERIVKRPMYYSYGGVRQMAHRQPLLRHRDTSWQSDFLLTWPVSHDGTISHPLYIESPDGTHGFDTSNVNMGLVFHARDRWHWRHPFEGRRAIYMYARFVSGSDRRRCTDDDIRMLSEAGESELDGSPLDESVHRRLIDVRMRSTKVLFPNCLPPYVIRKALYTPDEVQFVLNYVEARMRDAELAQVSRDGVDRITEDRTCRVLWVPAQDLPEPMIRRLDRAVMGAGSTVLPDVSYRHTLRLHEQIQIAIYEEGGYFDTHSDRGEEGTKSHARRASLIMALENPKIGGSLQLTYENPVELSPGDALLISADTEHRVVPVRAGRRISLVAWWRR